MKTANDELLSKAGWVWAETLRMHRLAPETRVASSLSAVEIFTTLYYGDLLAHNGADPRWEGRDRLIVSKGHGSISLFPILADRGYFDRSELEGICREGSFLGGIPDTIIPGYETINGSLGHGIGVACGMALGLKCKGSPSHIFVVAGDGEFCEGSMWEGVMFAAHHRLDNLTVIIDNNKLCMLDRCENIMTVEPFDRRFEAFGWEARRVDGHDIPALREALTSFKQRGATGRPSVLIADTVKGRGVPELELDTLCHIRTLTPSEIDRAMGGAQ
ncbi:MAG: transketolase [Geobacteraceae bacterium GWC2_55_20]|nr:MAG: transketolase [Geobacteraceae bacterium GWC2_55_20]OGU21583.1 MAG: transketolase [Geobacteraceae bacterium GWF2_54_21]